MTTFPLQKKSKITDEIIYFNYTTIIGITLFGKGYSNYVFSCNFPISLSLLWYVLLFWVYGMEMAQILFFIST